MDLFHSDDFHDSIDDMCDDALRRMYAFQEGGLAVMQPSDAYYSEILRRDDVLEVVEFDTVARAVIAEDIHADVVRDELPDYALGTLAGATMVLARHAAHLGRGSDVIVPNQEMARGLIGEKLLLGKRNIEEKTRLSLLRYELGSLGTASLILGPDGSTWSLYYEAHRRVSLVRGA